MSKWTDEEALAAFEAVLNTDDPAGVDGIEVGRALLDARERAEKAEAINAELRQQATASRENASNLAVQLGDAREQVDVLKAEVRAWRERLSEFYHDDESMASIRAARAATDALFKEGL